MKKLTEKLKYKTFIFFAIFFLFLNINLIAETKDTKGNLILKYCDKTLNSYSEFMCTEQKVHESMINNPLGFVIFYVVGILFIAFLYRMSTRNLRGKNNKK
tara:strand:+ start:1114 stop:1416 length:303 start_codon:yes stop_codon:yes gene_type:complete